MLPWTLFLELHAAWKEDAPSATDVHPELLRIVAAVFARPEQGRPDVGSS